MSHAEKCPVCEGSGKVETKCHGCDGKGWVEVQDNAVPYIPYESYPYTPWYPFSPTIEPASYTPWHVPEITIGADICNEIIYYR